MAAIRSRDDHDSALGAAAIGTSVADVRAVAQLSVCKPDYNNRSRGAGIVCSATEDQQRARNGLRAMLCSSMSDPDDMILRHGRIVGHLAAADGLA
jgi:hypothetical protein